MALTTNPHVWKILSVVFILMALILGVLFYFKDIFVTLLLGVSLIFITCKLRTLYRHVFRRRLPDGWFKTFILIMIVIIFLSAMYWLVDHTVTEIQDVMYITTQDFSDDATLLDVYSARITQFIPSKVEAVVFTSENLARMKAFFLKELGSSIPILTKQLLTALLIVPLLFYLYFRRGKKLLQRFYLSIPKKFSRSVKNAVVDASRELNDYFTGKLMQSAVIALICILGFSISGVKAWLFFGLLAGTLNIIPFIGPLLGAIPPLFIALLDPSGNVALGVLLTVVVAQLVDNFYLQPFMLSSLVKLDPLLAILLVLAFAKLFGALGMILAIPIYSVFKITLRELYTELVEVYGRH